MDSLFYIYYCAEANQVHLIANDGGPNIYFVCTLSLEEYRRAFGSKAIRALIKGD